MEGELMAVIVDQLGLVIPGNIVKHFDGKDSTLRVTREQLDLLLDEAQAAKAIFSGTEASPTPKAVVNPTLPHPPA
jgi:hypothetical protein